MFSSSVNYHPTQNYSNSQSVKISAVSGTFVKSHPKSFFVFGQFGSEVLDKLAGHSPKYLKSSKEVWVDGAYHSRGHWSKENEWVDVIILQAMCAHQEYMMFELMFLEDWEASLNSVNRGVNYENY